MHVRSLPGSIISFDLSDILNSLRKFHGLTTPSYAEKFSFQFLSLRQLVSCEPTSRITHAKVRQFWPVFAQLSLSSSARTIHSAHSNAKFSGVPVSSPVLGDVPGF